MAELIPARAADEARHTPGTEELWAESWYLDFFDADAGIGGYVRLGHYPNLGETWYWGCVVGPDRQLVTVIDHGVPPLKGTEEIRSEGLWADYIVETALDHVTVGLEAFGVGLDDPTETYGALRGDRVPLGFDLEWETEGGTFAYPGVDRYEVPCRVHGEVLVGQETIEVNGWGQRDHSWGVRDWWSIAWSWMAGRLDDGTRIHGTAVDFAGAQVYATGYVQDPSGLLVPTEVADHREETDGDGLPTAGTWTLADLEVEITPIAFSPVLLTAPDGRVSRFPRAWCRFRAADGRRGEGWVEWNQPQ